MSKCKPAILGIAPRPQHSGGTSGSLCSVNLAGTNRYVTFDGKSGRDHR